MGLFVDLRGTYTLANGSSTAVADGATATTAAGDQVTYKTSGASAIGGGLTIGYDIASGLGLVAGYDIRSFKTREFKGRASDYFDLTSNGQTAQDSTASAIGATTTTGTASMKWTNQVITLGLRPHVSAFGGEIYGGAGLAVVLPFETTQTVAVSSASATWNVATDTATSAEIVKKYNLGLGAYGEVGYQYMFTDMIGLNVGIRALVATTDNKDQTRVRTVKNAGTGTTTLPTVTTTTYTDSLSKTEGNGTNTAAVGTAKAQFETLGITDFSATVGLTLKF